METFARAITTLLLLAALTPEVYSKATITSGNLKPKHGIDDLSQLSPIDKPPDKKAPLTLKLSTLLGPMMIAATAKQNKLLSRETGLFEISEGEKKLKRKFVMNPKLIEAKSKGVRTRRGFHGPPPFVDPELPVLGLFHPRRRYRDVRLAGMVETIGNKVGFRPQRNHNVNPTETTKPVGKMNLSSGISQSFNRAEPVKPVKEKQADRVSGRYDSDVISRDVRAEMDLRREKRATKLQRNEHYAIGERLEKHREKRSINPRRNSVDTVVGLTGSYREVHREKRAMKSRRNGVLTEFIGWKLNNGLGKLNSRFG